MVSALDTRLPPGFFCGHLLMGKKLAQEQSFANEHFPNSHGRLLTRACNVHTMAK